MSNPSNVLALQEHGGSKTIVIRESKCLIRTIVDNQQVDCCAIFSGPNGTAMRSYVSDVLVNGVPATVRSLATGDEIELPCRTKLTVQAATEIRPVISERQHSVQEIDQQLSSLTGQPPLAKQDPAVISQDSNEEKFLSPFSEDLPQVLAEANLAASTAEPVPPAPNAVAGSDSDATSTLDSLIANVTSLDPAAEQVAEVQVNDTPADNSVVASVETNNQIGGLDDIQRHLQSLISGSVPEAPQTEANVTNDASPFGSATAGVVGGIASAAAATVAASVIHNTNNETASQQAEPTPPPAVPVQAAPTNVAPQNTVAANESQTNASAELPADLRNQLDDLMASLENQTTNDAAASSAAPGFTSPATPEFTTPAPIASAETPATPVPPVSTLQPGFQAAPIVQAAPPLDVETNAVPPVAETPVSTLPPVFATAATQVPVPVDVEIESAAPATVAPSPENRSVAEILGSMGIDVPGEDPNLSSNSGQADQPPAPEPIPEPTQMAPETPVFTDTQPTNREQDPATGVESEDANDDIQAYMNRLLNRGSAEGAPVPEPVVAPVAEEEQVEIVVPLSQEEFVPNHKATRPANYESLREIANSSNRAALELSAVKGGAGGSLLRLFVGLAASAAAIVTFLMGLGYIASVLLIVAVVGFALYSVGRKAETKAISEVMEQASQSKPS